MRPSAVVRHPYATAHRKQDGHRKHSVIHGAAALLASARHALILVEPSPVELSTSPVDQLGHHVPFSPVAAFTAHEVLGQHAQVDYEGIDSLLRLGRGGRLGSGLGLPYDTRGAGVGPRGAVPAVENCQNRPSGTCPHGSYMYVVG